MRRQPAIKILFLLAFAGNGICVELDLNEVVKFYINKMGAENVESYSLGSDYPYWTKERHPKYPITARVTNFSYSKAEYLDLNFRSTVCRDKFVWKFNSVLWSPCVIPVDQVIYGMHEGKPTLLPVQLHLDNRPSIEWEPQKWNITDGPVTISLVKHSCEFRAEVLFDGWFVYKMKQQVGIQDNLGYVAEGVDKLANESLGLVEKGDHLLEYTMTGMYTHTMICSPTRNIKEVVECIDPEYKRIIDGR
ncbi:uncharacterized protein LOC125945186 [Dermacentor silvarum]|uniref:uncharacterized protein LOC125945186 n=1 Tax=Dermacentor silvarum TaxID=543639 RepID=UPI0021019938|nr:uncharacterized protein LOC125945186 [Dermacentor silvarum]